MDGTIHIGNLQRIWKQLLFVNSLILRVTMEWQNISQIGSFPQVGVKIKNIWNHQVVMHLKNKACDIAKGCTRCCVFVSHLEHLRICIWILLIDSGYILTAKCTWQMAQKGRPLFVFHLLYRHPFFGTILGFCCSVSRRVCSILKRLLGRVWIC